MRLLFVIDSLGGGGAQRQMVSLARTLAHRGHEVQFFVYHDLDFFGAELREANIPVTVCHRKSRLSLAPVTCLRRRFRGDNLDAVVSFLAVPNIFSLLAGSLLKSRPPLIVSHRSSAIGDSYTWRDRLATRMYRLADHVTTNSHHMCAFLKQKLPLLAGRISPIWNGVDLERFAPAERPAPGETLRLLAVGNVSPGKNWFTLAKALVILRREHGIMASVSLAGRLDRLSRRHERYLANVRSYLAANQLAASWKWLGMCDEMPSLYHTHDVLVHPSNQEGLPNAICEALAAGCPVIAGDVLDHGMLVEHGQNGLLFDVASADHLAQQLRNVHDMTHAHRQRMGQLGSEFAAAKLSLAECASKYEALLSQLVASGATPRIEKRHA